MLSPTTRRHVSSDEGVSEDDWQLVDSHGQPEAAETEGLYHHIRSSSDHPNMGAPLASAVDPDSSRSSFTWRVVAQQGASAGSFEDVDDGFQSLTPAPVTTRTVNPAFSPGHGSTTSLAVAAMCGSGGGSAASSAKSVPVSNADGGRLQTPGSMEDDGSYASETSSISQSMTHSTQPLLVCSSTRTAAVDGIALHQPSAYSSDTWDLVIISKVCHQAIVVGVQQATCLKVCLHVCVFTTWKSGLQRTHPRRSPKAHEGTHLKHHIIAAFTFTQQNHHSWVISGHPPPVYS